MKKRVTSGSVTVTGPPARICSRNSGTTLPAESSTLPKRTVTKRVERWSRQRLADHLGQALGRAQHVDRIDRLVGGDQHERADAGVAARARDGLASPARCCARPRAAALRAAAPACRRRRGTPRPARRVRSACAITAGSPQSPRIGDAFEVREVAPQRGFGRGQGEFVDLDQGDAARAVARALAAQLRTDRAAGAGHQHRARRPASRGSPSSPAAPACGRAGPRSRLPSVRPAANALRARPAGAAPCGTAGRCVRTPPPRAAAHWRRPTAWR